MPSSTAFFSFFFSSLNFPCLGLLYLWIALLPDVFKAVVNKIFFLTFLSESSWIKNIKAVNFVCSFHILYLFWMCLWDLKVSSWVHGSLKCRITLSASKDSLNFFLYNPCVFHTFLFLVLHKTLGTMMSNSRHKICIPDAFGFSQFSIMLLVDFLSTAFIMWSFYF